jgi:hypothetical protein
MPKSAVVAFLVAIFCVQTLPAQKQLAKSPQILSAKSVYFRNTTGSDPVGKNALAALKKWQKYRLVTEPAQADLIFLLSSDPYKGGSLIFADGQTGSIDSGGNVTKDSTPNFNKLAPTRYAYLTVIDRRTGNVLWSDSHVWGGLLTGFDGAGARLVRELQNQIQK